MVEKTTTLTLDVVYDADETTPMNAAITLDMLLDNAMSTPGILDGTGVISTDDSGFQPPRDDE